MAVLGGCPGTLDDPDRFARGGGSSGGCPDIPTELFADRCATAGCHNADDAAGSLNLDASGLEARIVDVDAVGCDGKLVDTADPEASVMYTKCLESNDCASRMPLTGTDLNSEELQCLLDYLSTL